MYRFFVDSDQIDTKTKRVVITGQDRNHIKNVLRMHEGEEISVMIPGNDDEYRCTISGYSDEEVLLTLLFVKESNVELPCEAVLYQALPKADKMEQIITKAVELGVHRIVPVATERAVVKLDKDRACRKVERWNAISEAAAKQSKRSVIPEVTHVMTMPQALAECSLFETRLIPYEMSDPGSMDRTRRLISSIKPGTKIAVFIGPEGGFTDGEIALAKENGFEPMTLGHRILRTETAGIVLLSWIMYNLES